MTTYLPDKRDMLTIPILINQRNGKNEDIGGDLTSKDLMINGYLEIKKQER